MVMLFSVAGLFAWFVFFMVLFWLFGKIAKGGDSKSQNSSGKNSGTLSFTVYEKPKVDWEAPGDDGGIGKYSSSVPKDVEEIELLITEKDGHISADVYSITHRGGFHEKTIFFDHVDPNNIYKVTIPPDAGEVNLIIKETDHKISVEVESVEKREEASEN